MGFGFESKTSSTKETKDRSLTSTRTPIVPDWISNAVQRATGQIDGLMSLDPTSLVAPVHGLQGQAANTAQNLGGQLWNYEGALDVTRGVASSNWLDNYMQAPATPRVRGESLLDNLPAYMSPYTQDVVDAALADFDYGAGRTRAQQDLELAASGAFGGSGAALTRSMTEDALARARATTSANLRDQAFTRGAALSSDDANRRQQAALANAQMAQQDWNQRVGQYLAGQDQRLRAADQLASLVGAYEGDQRANIATQGELGSALREVEQQYRQAPISHAQQIVAMLGGLPYSMFAGEQLNESERSKTKTSGVEVNRKTSFP